MAPVENSLPMTIIFDVDGILVDNVQFEEEVTSYIVQKLAEAKKIGLNEAQRCWLGTLEKHRDHPEWHDYALHCKALGIENAWKEGHELHRETLTKFAGIDEVLDVARRAGRCWVASDATRWVVDFKLAQVGLNDYFDDVITASRWKLNKGEKEYWRQLGKLLPCENAPVLFIENRQDRIATALEALKNCICVWIQTQDHAEIRGFRKPDTRLYRESQSVIVSTHESLASTVSELLSEGAKSYGTSE